MLPDDIHEELPKEVFDAILKALHIDMGDFMYNLFNDNPYELMIFEKIYELYNETRKQASN